MMIKISNAIPRDMTTDGGDCWLLLKLGVSVPSSTAAGQGPAPRWMEELREDAGRLAGAGPFVPSVAAASEQRPGLSLPGALRGHLLTAPLPRNLWLECFKQLRFRADLLLC